MALMPIENRGFQTTSCHPRNTNPNAHRRNVKIGVHAFERCNHTNFGYCSHDDAVRSVDPLLRSFIYSQESMFCVSGLSMRKKRGEFHYCYYYAV